MSKPTFSHRINPIHTHSKRHAAVVTAILLIADIINNPNALNRLGRTRATRIVDAEEVSNKITKLRSSTLTNIKIIIMSTQMHLYAADEEVEGHRPALVRCRSSDANCISQHINPKTDLYRANTLMKLLQTRSRRLR